MKQKEFLQRVVLYKSFYRHNLHFHHHFLLYNLQLLHLLIIKLIIVFIYLIYEILKAYYLFDKKLNFPNIKFLHLIKLINLIAPFYNISNYYYFLLYLLINYNIIIKEFINIFLL